MIAATILSGWQVDRNSFMAFPAMTRTQLRNLYGSVAGSYHNQLAFGADARIFNSLLHIYYSGR